VKKIKLITALFLVFGFFLLIATASSPAKKAEASLNHTQIFPHTKVWLTDYMTDGRNSPYQNPEVRQFIATHYDAMAGAHDYTAEGGTAPVFAYTNYYCMYVRNLTDDPDVSYNEYVRAYNWARDHDVNFEDFFIHYAPGTTVSSLYFPDKTAYTLPTQECIASATAQGYLEPERTCRRVPTYDWYTGGDMSKSGARLIMNVGNPNYRAWKLEDIGNKILNKPYLDGVMIDNSPIDNRVGTKYPENQTGSTDFIEYFRDNGETTPVDGDSDLTAGEKYSNDLVTMFREFHERFPDKGQMPNAGPFNDYAYISTLNPKPELNARIYPYVYGFFREAALQASKNYATAFTSGLHQNIANSEAAGVKLNMIGEIIYGGVAPDPIDRFVMPQLAEYYLIKSDTTAFHPFLQYIADQWGIDPRQNQWFEAVAYNVGQPKNDANDPANPSQKFKVMAVGINPASANKTSMNVQTVEKIGFSYQLTDPSANWTDEQWKGKSIIFPDGRVKSVYHSGLNWISLYWGGTEEPPSIGTYQIGDYSYTVYYREFENAIAVYKPLAGITKKDASTSMTENLPATADNPTGRYYSLKMDGTLDPSPITQISLRNTDGAVLIKESALGRPTISKTVNKTSASSGETLTYTIFYSNPAANTYTNVILEDPIPLGTTYINGSAANGGTSDGTKVIWNLSSLSPGASGTVSFQVRIN